MDNEALLRTYGSPENTTDTTVSGLRRHWNRTLAVITIVSGYFHGQWINLLAFITTVSGYLLQHWINLLAFINTVSGYLYHHWIKTLAVFALALYLTLVIFTFCFYRNQYSGNESHPFVDAFYFSIVTMTTVGYGDIVPLTTMTKIISIGFVIISIVFFDIVLNFVVDHVLSLQEKAILALAEKRNREIVEEDGVMKKMKMVWRLRLVVCVIVVCVGIGACVLCFVEKLGFVDSVYLSVMSVSTVGYGDEAFKTVYGRGFAVFWLVLSSISMACFYYSFAEMRTYTKVVEPMRELEFVVLKLYESNMITVDDIKLSLAEYKSPDRVMPKNTLQQLLAANQD